MMFFDAKQNIPGTWFEIGPQVSQNTDGNGSKKEDFKSFLIRGSKSKSDFITYFPTTVKNWQC